jgi:hypothetical protein
MIDPWDRRRRADCDDTWLYVAIEAADLVIAALG